jgi:hypothetical protein
MTVVIAGVACVLVVAALYLGRRDLAHPAWAFAIPWFLWVAVAQLRLTTFEHSWSFSYAALVIGGGLLFSFGAVLAAGFAPVRGTLHVSMNRYSVPRFVAIAVALLITAGIGLAWKASIVGGVPLFSGEIDVLRARAHSEEHHVPGLVTVLTDGFLLALWLALASLVIAWDSLAISRRLSLGALATAAFLGTASSGSRNSMLGAIAVPIVAWYVLSRQSSSWRRRLIIFGGAVALVLLLAGYTAVRSGQTESPSERFAAHQAHGDQIRRAALLLYMGGVFGFEVERRVTELVPKHSQYANGVATLQLLPDRLFPHGKPFYDSVTTSTGLYDSTAPFWTVATYQGRAFIDFGVAGITFESLLLGLILGGAYRLCRSRSWLISTVIAGYAAYYALFLFYENLISINPTFAYDLLGLAIIEFCSRKPE